ncbi:MAG TPA: hypothetical protein VH880_04940 [Anaeromyxobacteraceae bacterium]|jgi:hypothetical protein
MQIGRALALAAALAACSRGGGAEDRGQPRILEAAPAPAPFDWSQPASALAMDGDEAARRIGSLEIQATISWSVGRGPESQRLRMAERHVVRQLAGGDFHALSELDPGAWHGAETGREVVFAGGATFARSRWSPFRERPADRGAEARRRRDESFRLAGDLATLYGPALRVDPGGEGAVLGRAARRFALSLLRGAAMPAPPPPPAALPPSGYDEDTRRRLDFLEGRVPLALAGEMALDAGSGVPLLVRMKGVLGERGDPELRAEFELEARVAAVGAAVGPVAAPRALPDERKPRGVARALEQAGLRRRGEAKGEEPRDEADAEAE